MGRVSVGAATQRLVNTPFAPATMTSDAMLAKGKLPIYSTQAHLGLYPALYHDLLGVLQKHGGGREWEYFCISDVARRHDLGGGTNSSCLNEVLSLQLEASLGIPAMVHATCPGNTTAAHDIHLCNETMAFQLAAFLVAAGKYQYFAWSAEDHWELRPPAFRLQPQFDKALGAPQGAAVRHGHSVFTREFAHLSVWVDVVKREAKLDWKVP